MLIVSFLGVNMEILYEDKEIIVVIKPVGIVSQESSDKRDMINILKEHTGTDIYPVHRLDKGVGGVMAYANPRKSAAELSRQIQCGSFIKEYYAAVHGILGEKEGVFEDLLFKDSRKNKTFVVKRMRKGVKDAKLSYTVLCEGKLEEKDVTVVKVRLFTGRSHQIRVQFASRKHPLIGDGRYGGTYNNKNIELFSGRLTFTHPSSKKEMTFTAVPGDDLFMSSLLIG